MRVDTNNGIFASHTMSTLLVRHQRASVVTVVVRCAMMKVLRHLGLAIGSEAESIFIIKSRNSNKHWQEPSSGNNHPIVFCMYVNQFNVQACMCCTVMTSCWNVAELVASAAELCSEDLEVGKQLLTRIALVPHHMRVRIGRVGPPPLSMRTR